MGIISLFGGFGVIVIIISIFTSYIRFNLALTIAIFLWLMTEVFKSFVQIDEMNNSYIFDFKRAFVRFLSVLSIWVIVFSIFLNGIDFQLAIVIAVILGIFAGIFAQFLGISTTKTYPRRHQVSYTQKPIPIDYFEQKNQFQRLAKIRCLNCGSSIIKNDVFCGECGEKVS